MVFAEDSLRWLSFLLRPEDKFLSERANSGNQSSSNTFLNLIADPFSTQVQANSIYAALIWSFAVSGGLFLGFIILRPRISHVYARRLKHSDQKHAPLRLQRTLLGWIPAITQVTEEELVLKIGLDAVVFLRFLRMLRDMFLVISVIGCAVIIPINLVGGHTTYDEYGNVSTLLKFTPQYIFGHKFWAFVVCSYLFQGIVCFFIWWNYRTVLRLRQAYFRSDDYTESLHSRTLLLRHLPRDARSDTAIAELVSATNVTDEVPRTAIGRNVRKWHLEELIEEHDQTVKQLEKCLAKYLADPVNLPPERPMCKPSKKDREATPGVEVDAISYLEARRMKLAEQILEARESVDKRDPESYGFASYATVEAAHAVAYMNHSSAKNRKNMNRRQKQPNGPSISLAPRPHDILWQNLPMTRTVRRNRMFWDSVWMALLTIAFVIPNILTSVFLSDLSHLGQVWPGFQKNLEAHPTGWGIAQGIIAPAVQSLFYLILPAIFRKILTHSGDSSRTRRERHVTSRLYTFFIINQLIVFCIFAVVFRYAAAVVSAKNKGVWEALKEGHLFSQLMIGLCNVSTFWLTWQMQHNLSAATDLSQLLPLAWSSFQKRFMNPTIRELEELTEPQPFEYADYYNNFLFSATVGLCFATLQPVILPVTAFYLIIEVWFKKYMLQYILCTKHESGGAFWRMVINRLLFAVVLSNAVIALVVGAQGVGADDAVRNGGMLYAMVPLPFLLAGFKYYLLRNFDSKMAYIDPNPLLASGQSGARNFSTDDEGKPTTPEKKVNPNALSVRFGHPALYRPLIEPKVHPRAQHLLAEVLGHPLSESQMDASGNEYDDDEVDFAPDRPVLPYSGSAIYLSPLKKKNGASGSTSSVAALVSPSAEARSGSDASDFEHSDQRPLKYGTTLTPTSSTNEGRYRDHDDGEDGFSVSTFGTLDDATRPGAQTSTSHGESSVLK